jgi:hypothetical protein
MAYRRLYTVIGEHLLEMDRRCLGGEGAELHPVLSLRRAAWQAAMDEWLDREFLARGAGRRFGASTANKGRRTHAPEAAPIRRTRGDDRRLEMKRAERVA